MKNVAILALAGALVCSSASAITDTREFLTPGTGTTFFVPAPGQELTSPYYRGANGDWGWTHAAIGGPITTADLSVSAYDVDFSSGELDGIYAKDDGVLTFLGFLSGTNNAFSFTTFTLGANFYNDIAAGLEVFINIDQGSDGWLTSVSKSVLRVDGGSLPNPNPTVPDGGATVALLGGAALALATLKRSRK